MALLSSRTPWLGPLTRAAVGTLAVEGGHTVMAGGPIEAGSAGTVVNVLAAVFTRPAIDTHAVVAALGVVAGATVLAGIGHELTLVHILCAELTCGARKRQPRCHPRSPPGLALPLKLAP